MELTFEIIAHGSETYREMVALRYRILREPLGLGFTDAQLAAEATDILIGAFADGRMVGCLVLTPQPDSTLVMRQVAVDTQAQGLGVGRQLVAFSEQVAKERGFSRLELHARESAVPFYEKCGYEVISEMFIEVTLPHRTMQKHFA